MQQLFKKSADVKFQQYTFDGHTIHLITCEAMIDLQLLNEVIVPRVGFLCSNLTDEPLETQVESQLYVPDLKKVKDEQEAILLVYTGFVLLYFEEGELLFSSNIAKKPNRNPEETNVEVTIKGPRDNFIEDVAVNIAIIRKRLPTNSLCVEKFELGKRSKTKVAILYFDDIANKDKLNELKAQLEKVNTDAVFSGDILMERVDKSAPLFPRHDYTGRPDYVVQCLVRGRFVLFVDGASYAMITPVNLFLLLKTSEDDEYPVLYGSVERAMRIVGLLIGALLPAFWLCLTTFHQNQLPFQLLATVVQASTGLPFPTAIEMLIMLAMFELFREAGLRLPIVLGGTIGVVGGLIIGDAAIRAGITSPAMVVVIATSTIATFTLVNQNLSTAISLMRVFFILLSAFLGLFGFFLSYFFTLVYLSNIRIFGYPYMNIATDLSWSTIAKAIFRLPAKKYTKRPDALKTIDNTRTQVQTENQGQTESQNQGAQNQTNTQNQGAQNQTNTQNQGTQTQLESQNQGTQNQTNTQDQGNQTQLESQNQGTQNQTNTQGQGTQAQTESQNQGNQAQTNTQNQGTQAQTDSQNQGAQGQTNTQNQGTQTQPDSQNQGTQDQNKTKEEENE